MMPSKTSKIPCSVTEFYSAADNLVGLINENFRAIRFEQISRHSILTRRNITQKNFFGARPLSQYASFKRRGQIWTTPI
jgi:hypothetical protein